MGPCEVPNVGRTAVKVYLSSQEISILDQITYSLGQGRSGVLRTAFLSYAKDLSLIQERVHDSPGDRRP